MIRDLIPEPQLARAIAEATGAACPYTYVALSNRRRSGAWPAVQVGTRWHVRRNDLPAVIASLGLAVAPTRSQKPAKYEKRTSR